MKTRMGIFCRIFGLCLLLIQCLVLVGESRTSELGFVYIYNCGGNALKLDLRTRRIVSEFAFSGLGDLAKRMPQGNFDGCLGNSMRFAPKSGLLYSVFPKEARVNENDTRHYQIIVFQLPQLTMIGAIDLEQLLEFPPAILLSGDGKRLLIGYMLNVEGKQPSGVIESYDAGSLKIIEVIRQASNAKPVNFSEEAYGGEDGRTIYDRDNKITITGQTATLKSLDPAQLDKVDRPVTFADSAAGSALLFIESESGIGDKFFTIDLDQYRPSTIIEGPLVTSSTLHLTPNARQIVVEEIERRNDGGKLQLIKTGKLLIYDVASGKPVRQSRSRQLEGAKSRLVGITPDGAHIFYAIADKLYLVTTADGATELLKGEFSADAWTRCVFTDR